MPNAEPVPYLPRPGTKPVPAARGVPVAAWLAPLALALGMELAALGVAKHVLADARLLQSLAGLQSLASAMTEHLQRVQSGHPVEGRDLARHASAFGRQLEDCDRVAGGGLALPWESPFGDHDLADLSREWHRLEPRLRAAAATPVDDPAGAAVFVDVDAGVQRLDGSLARRVSALQEEERAFGRLLLVFAGTGAALLTAAFAVLVVAVVRGRRRAHERRTLLRRYEVAASESAAALVALDPALRLIWANDAFARLVGLPDGVPGGRPLLPLVAPDADSAENQRAIREALHEGREYVREWTFTGEGGRVRRVELRLRAAGADGVSGLLRDLTPELESERAARDHERLFQRAFAAMPDGFVLQAADGRIELCNAGAERILGLATSQLMGRTSTDPRWRSIREDGSLLPGEEQPAMIALRTGRASTGNLMGVHKPDGQLTWIRVDVTPLVRDGDAKPYAVLSTFTDVTARRLADSAIRKLTQAVEQSPVPVVITDANGSIEYANRQFERTTGYAVADVIGRNPRVLASGETPRATYAEMWGCLKSGREWRGVLVNRRRSGEIYETALSVFPLRDASGRTTNYVAYHQDMDEARRREQEMKALADGAVRAMRERAEFLQAMSREMVGPLEGIARTADELMLESAGGEAVPGLRSIRRSSEQLLSVIHQLFDLSWLEGPGRRSTDVPFRLRALVREVLAALARDGRPFREMPSVVISPDVPDAFRGDAGALRQLLLSLAGDAATGARSSRVEVRVGAVPVEPGRPRLQFEVRRHGTGLSLERRREIERVIASPTGTTPAASDLGPALVARLAVHLGGGLQYTAEDEECDVWRFDAGFDLAETPAVEWPERPQPGRRVLVVDGGAAGGTGLRDALEALRVAAACVADAAAAREELARADARGTPYEAIVVEARARTFDPFAVAAHLLAAGAARSEPVLLLTAVGDRGDAERCQRLGVRGYLSMPFGDLDLAEALGHLTQGAAGVPLVTRHWLREQRPPRRVLVVGEDALAQGAQRTLALAGYEVVGGAAPTGAGGPAAPFDAVLLSAAANPALDPEALRSLLDSAGTAERRPACVLLGGSPEGAARVPGVDACVPEPLHMDVLLGVLQPLIGERPRGLEPAREPASRDDEGELRRAA